MWPQRFHFTPSEGKKIIGSYLKLVWSYAFIATAVLLSGCVDKEVPDIYYLRIGDALLAVPNAYMIVGSHLDAHRNREVRIAAASPPGFKVQQFFMMLDADTLKPYVPRPGSRLNIDMRMVVLADLESDKAQSPAGVAAEIKLSGQRAPAHDAFGLTAYEEATPSFKKHLYYLGKLEDGSDVALECRPFERKDAKCRVSALWHGLKLNYELRNDRRSEWRSIAGRLLEVLKPFIVSH